VEPLLRRQRAPENDPEDQRSKRIHLTECGHAAARTVRKIVREVEDDWEKQLGKKRFGQLRELLVRASVRSC